MSVGLQASRATSEPTGSPTLRPASEPSRLLVSGVSKSWNGKPTLGAVDLTLEPGELVGLVGSNGVGKTTLLRIVAGLIAPDRGSVRLDGIDVWTERRKYQRRLGFVPAGQTGLYARICVRDQLDYWARIAFIPRSQRHEAVERAIERFALGELSARRVERLSMGQRQRVRLAMGLLHDPQLLLLDEPRNSLDSAGLEVLHRALTEFVTAGGTVLWCAPEADDIGVATSRAYMLIQGSLSPA